ncbi:hypothetical protein ACEPAH_7372 [Sanghuangporus vaninii]
MTTNKAQSETSTRKSSRLAEKASQQVPSNSQRTHSSTSNSARNKRTRRSAEGKEHFTQRSSLSLAAKERSRREKRKSKAVSSATQLDANDPGIANEPICTGAANDQDPLIDLVKKRKKTITSSQRKATFQQTQLDERPNETRNWFFTLQAKGRDSDREHVTASGSGQSLPPTHRLKVDPYGEPFRKCRQKASPSNVLPEPVDTILSRLRERALKNASPASAESGQSGEGSNDETLTGHTPNRKRQRDEFEGSADEKIRTSGTSACVEKKNDQSHKPGSTASTPPDRSTKRIRYCDTGELTTRTRSA